MLIRQGLAMFSLVPRRDAINFLAGLAAPWGSAALIWVTVRIAEWTHLSSGPLRIALMLCLVLPMLLPGWFLPRRTASEDRPADQ
jgi:hypothetical protein